MSSSQIAKEQSPPLLAITHANKSYHGVPALINGSLQLEAGQVHALVGENGAGKSTLIKLLAGVLSPDSMTVAMQGRPVKIHHAQDAFNAGLRFIHQELNVVPYLSVAENIYLSQPYPTYLGSFVNWRLLNQRATDVLKRLGVTHILPRTQMSRLSPGNQMLVKIASMFVDESLDNGQESNAWVYVLDEPTAALTGQEAAMLFAVIKRLQAHGRAILYVSHRMDEIFEIADQVTVMRDGRVEACKPIVETSPGELIHLMTGRELTRTYPPRETQPRDHVLLNVQHLSTQAVQDVTFHLQESEVLGVAGLNGSGRTELLRALMGADPISSGDIMFDGSVFKPGSPAASWDNGIAFVPEERRSQGLILSRSISDNITLPHLHEISTGNLFLNRRLEHAKSEALGESVRLKAIGPHQITRQLSGGNQQKVVFARALARQPRVLLLDEPTRGVDVGAKYDIYRLIHQTIADGTGIIMVSSDLSELLGLCDRIMVMRHNRLFAIVPAQGLTEEELLSICYGRNRHDD